MARGEDTGNHPNRQVSNAHFEQLALDTTVREPPSGKMKMGKDPNVSSGHGKASQPAAVSGHPRAMLAQMTYDPANRQHFEDRYRQSLGTGYMQGNRPSKATSQMFLKKHYERAHGMGPSEASAATQTIANDMTPEKVEARRQVSEGASLRQAYSDYYRKRG